MMFTAAKTNPRSVTRNVLLMTVLCGLFTVSFPAERVSASAHLIQEYRIGDVKVVGNRRLDQLQIRFLLKLDQGSIFNEDEFRKGAETLKRLYGRGYFKFVAKPELVFDEERKVVNLTIHVDEGDQFRLNRLSITGNRNISDERIRREIMITEGHVFNTAAWDMSLARLNSLGYFEEIQDSDITIKTSETEATLDIILNVREK